MRKRAPKLDRQPYFELLGATKHPDAAHMARLPDGSWLTVAGGKAGKVSIGVSGNSLEARWRHRTFGVNQHEEIREWVLSGGKAIAKEEALKAARAAGPELLAILKEHLRWYDGATDIDETSLIAQTRAVIDKAEAKTGTEE